MRKTAVSLILGLSVIGGAIAQIGMPFPGPGAGRPYATRLDPTTVTNSGPLTNNNLTFEFATNSGNVVRSMPPGTATAKVYFEVTTTTCTSCGAGYTAWGVIDDSQTTVTPVSVATVTAKMWEWRTDALKVNNGSSASLGSTASQGAVYSVAFDNSLGSGSGKIWWGSCSAGTVTWYGSGNPATGANAAYSNLTGTIKALINYYGNAEASKLTVNFGASAYTCTPPSGFGNF